MSETLALIAFTAGLLAHLAMGWSEPTSRSGPRLLAPKTYRKEGQAASQQNAPAEGGPDV